MKTAPFRSVSPEISPLALPRRAFLKSLVAGTGALTVGPDLALLAAEGHSPSETTEKPDYRGPNVIIVRFGGGVRRRESIDPDHTYAPFLCHEFAKRGTLYKRMDIDFFQDINTSHGEGTLYILTGKYEKFKDVTGRFMGARFEASVPTVFEYLRKSFNIPDHQTQLVNGEDREDEEFY